MTNRPALSTNLMRTVSGTFGLIAGCGGCVNICYEQARASTQRDPDRDTNSGTKALDAR
jgi:hypothetical protein